jgi:hypothetical protein
MQLLLGLASAVFLGSQYGEADNHIFLPQIPESTTSVNVVAIM